MILPDEETGAANVRLTHSVDIFAFVEAEEIPFSYFETPYYLAPAPGDERVYTLLRETLNRTGKIGIAYVVIRARKQLAALVPCGPALVLNTLRSGVDTPFMPRDDAADQMRAIRPTEHELTLAIEIVESMTQRWDSGLCSTTTDEAESDTAGIGHLTEILGHNSTPPQDEDMLPGQRSLHQRERRSDRPRLRARRVLH